MTRTTTMVLGMVAAAGTMLGGCSAGQWERLGDRLIDGVTLDVGLGSDGSRTIGVGFSSELSAQRSLERQHSSMKQRLVASAMGAGGLESQAGMSALTDDEQLRRMIREMVVAEMFPEQADRLPSGR